MSKTTKFTESLRKEICAGDSYWIQAPSLAIHVSQTVDFDWDGKGSPTLKKVITDLVEGAYHKGKEDGAREVRGLLKKALGHS